MIIPWEVDAPHERWPVTNWLIIVACVLVHALQIKAFVETGNEDAGITGVLLLDGWHLRGLLGYMWLHGGLMHLIGNMLFLWIFGNAVCATLGNIRYLFLYLFWGVCSGCVHLLTSDVPVLGASGAINGVVGVFLFLYAKNQITCLFWFFLLYARTFSVSSYVMILWWLFWDLFGAFSGEGGGVAYCAHLGGFLAGFVTAYVLCLKGWVSLLKYEESLLDIWRKSRQPEEKDPCSPAYGQFGMLLESQERVSPAPAPIALRPMSGGSERHVPGMRLPDLDASPMIRFSCTCGHRIQVPGKHAGRSGRCPNCRAVLRIPPNSVAQPPTAALRRDTESAIRFVCSCGKRIKVPVKFAGRAGRCPACQQTLRIPEAG